MRSRGNPVNRSSVWLCPTTDRLTAETSQAIQRTVIARTRLAP